VAKSYVTDIKESKNKNEKVYLVSVLQMTSKWEEELGECGKVAIRNVFILFNYQSQTTSSLCMNSGDYFNLG
jgi:uncharacterized protein YjaZ